MASPIPFWLHRPWLLWSGAWTDRDRPDLAWMAGLEDPWRFVWAMLPHAARSFGPSILSLPAPLARAVAVANLQCRALDTLEDRIEDPEEAARLLAAFAERFHGDTIRPAPEVEEEAWLSDGDRRDAAHRLLIAHVNRVDEAARTLDPEVREALVVLLDEMAAGMIVGRRLRASGEPLADAARDAYCDAVIGAPFRFCASLVHAESEVIGHARGAAICVQLANVVRDLEGDLERGVAWHPALQELLVDPTLPREQAIRTARRELTLRALDHARDLGAFLDGLARPGRGRIRLAGSLLLAFTARFWSGSVARLEGRRLARSGLLRTLLACAPTLWSARLTRRRIARSLAALEALRPHIPTPSASLESSSR